MGEAMRACYMTTGEHIQALFTVLRAVMKEDIYPWLREDLRLVAQREEAARLVWWMAFVALVTPREDFPQTRNSR